MTRTGYAIFLLLGLCSLLSTQRVLGQRVVNIEWTYAYENDTPADYIQGVFLNVQTNKNLYVNDMITSPASSTFQHHLGVDENITNIYLKYTAKQQKPANASCLVDIGFEGFVGASDPTYCYYVSEKQLDFVENGQCTWKNNDVTHHTQVGYPRFDININVANAAETKPITSDITEVKTIFCETESITFTVPCPFANATAYDWYYQYSGEGGWKLIKRTNTRSFTIGAGQDFLPEFNKTTFIRAKAIVYPSRGFFTAPTKSFTYYPGSSAPGIRGEAPSCYGEDDGSIIIPQIVGEYDRYTVNISSENNALEDYQLVVDGHKRNITLNKSVKDAHGFPIALSSGIWKVRIEPSGKDINNSCAYEEEITIPERPALQVALNPNTDFEVSCYGDIQDITATASGGAGGYTYEWKKDGTVVTGVTEATLEEAEASVAGITYTLTVTDQNGCFTTASTVLTQPEPLTIDASSLNQITYDNNYTYHVRCPGSEDGVVTVDIIGGTAPYQATLTDTDNTKTATTTIDESGMTSFTGIPAGSYTLTVEDASSCLFTYPESVVLTPPLPVVLDYQHTISPECAGDKTATLHLSGEHGIADNNEYTYTIEHLDVPDDLRFPFTNPQVLTADTAKFTDLIAGDYRVLVADQHGCQSAGDTITITEPAPIDVQFSTDRVTCYEGHDGRIRTTVSGGTPPYVLEWSGMQRSVDTVWASGETSVFDNLVGSTYSLLITDSKGCYYRSGYTPAIVVIESPKDPLTLYYDEQDLQPTSCHGAADGSVLIKSSGGWNRLPHKLGMDKNNLQYNQHFYGNLAPGSYWFYVEDDQGCQDSLEVTIVQPQPLTAQLSNVTHVSCYGDTDGSASVTAQGGVFPYQFSINGGATWDDEPSFTGLSAGTHTILVSDANQSCHATVTVEITEPLLLEASVLSVSNTLCGEQNGSASVQVQGGALPYTHAWYNADREVISTSTTASSLEAGLYQYIITDAQECSQSINVSVSATDGPEVVVSQVQGVSCADGKDGKASITVTQGIAPFVIRWPDGQTGEEATQLSTGTHLVEVTDANACTIIQEVVVPSPERVSITVLQQQAPTCFGACDGIIEIQGSGGSAPYTYRWNHSSDTPLLENRCSGTYQVTVTDANGCIAQQEVMLEEPDIIVVDLEESVVICRGQSYTIDGGYPGKIHHWTSDNGFESYEQIVTLSEPGIYKLSVSNKDGCGDTGEFELRTVDDLLSADFLLSSEAQVGDTVVMVNITWPFPDAIDWKIGENTTVVSQYGQYQEVVFHQEGTYTIFLDTRLGDCQDQISKQIVITNPSNDTQGARLRATGISNVQVYPNPNDGKFSANVTLKAADDIAVRLLNVKGEDMIKTIKKSGKDDYTFALHLPYIRQGVYFLVVETSQDRRVIRILIK